MTGLGVRLKLPTPHTERPREDTTTASMPGLRIWVELDPTFEKNRIRIQPSSRDGSESDLKVN